MQHTDKPSPSPNQLLTRNPTQTSFLFSSQRTGLAFQRTRLSADRTLMAVIRTSLSLISFGFTIFQIFWHLKEMHVQWNPTASKALGFSLVILGIFLQIIGIVYHLKFMEQIRIERNEMMLNGLLPTEDKFPVSFTLVTAILLLLIGITVTITMTIQSL